jgi:hypothetical protein
MVLALEQLFQAVIRKALRIAALVEDGLQHRMKRLRALTGRLH